MVYVNNDFSHCRKLSIVSWLPEFNMVDVKPEVHHYFVLKGISEKVQWLPAHFRLCPSTSDYADIVQHCDDHCSSSGDNQKSKWRHVNRKYAVSQNWVEVAEKFRLLPSHYRPRSFHQSYCQHCPTSVDNRYSVHSVYRLPLEFPVVGRNRAVLAVW